MLLSLKYLKLNSRLYWNGKLNRFKPNGLNAFRYLVHLEIDYYQATKLYLCLPNLEILSLNWWNNSCHIKLNLPKLQVLAYNEPHSEDLLRVEHPETIRVLTTQMFGAKLARFKKVECLKCSERYHDFLDRSTLLNLKQLKQVHYDVTMDSIKCFGNEEVMH